MAYLGVFLINITCSRGWRCYHGLRCGCLLHVSSSKSVIGSIISGSIIGIDLACDGTPNLVIRKTAIGNGLIRG